MILRFSNNISNQEQRKRVHFETVDIEGASLIFVGRFCKGIAFGPCWKFFEGGGCLYGIVDKHGMLSGLRNKFNCFSAF